MQTSGDVSGIKALWHKVRVWFVLVVMVGVVVWGGLKFRAGAAARTAHGAYYYDLGTGEVFTGPGDQILPIKAPGDVGEEKKSGVLAHVFSCADCGDAKERFVGWVETFDEAGVAEMRAGKGKGMPTATLLTMLREEPGATIRVAEPVSPVMWVAGESKEGVAVMKKGTARCVSEGAKVCVP